MPSEYFTEGRAWSDFESLEAQIEEFEAYVTLEPRNSRTYSRKISLMLFQTASQIEAFFKQALLDDSLDHSQQINQTKLTECRTKLQKNKQISISEFREVFDHFYQLAKWRISIGRPFLEYREIQPFIRFSKKLSPQWWLAYNKVKHDMFNNRTQGNLENLLQAMAGLFLLNVLHRPNQPVLILKDIIRNGAMSSPIGVGALAEAILWEKLGQIGVPQSGPLFALDIWARSKYFAVVLMQNGNWL